VLGISNPVVPTTFLSKTGSFTVAVTDGVDVTYFVDASGGAVTVTLPTAVGNLQRLTVIKVDSSANAVTIDPNSTETIGGETTLKCYRQRDFIAFVPDGTNWQVVAEKVTIYARVYRNTSAQVVATGTVTKVQCNGETEDSAAAFDSATNYNFTCPRAGRYSATGAGNISGANSLSIGYVYKNGAEVARGGDAQTSGDAFPRASDEIRCAVNDTLDFRVRHDRGSDANLNEGSTLTYFTVRYVGN